ncbi:hypothetical protein ACFQ1S_23970 [Kibdelosporangium lantanae]|uniref:Uncharacterized protein n=1 Tax=Kibdelosporangium lantanae TaxID=1497396 RepID=A0ABW3ME86_9PSEU
MYGVIRLGRQDLPKSIEAYLNIPRWLPGRGAEQLLTQLELLERESHRIAESFYAKDIRDQDDHTAYLREQFPKVVPNATDVDVRPFGGEAEGDFFPDQRYVTGTVEYTVNGQRTAIILQINMDPVQPNDDCTACQVVPQKDGSRITIVPMGKSGEPNGMDIITAQHDRTDRSVVTVTTYGYDPTGKGGTGARPQLTVDQVAKLAADPNLRI